MNEGLFAAAFSKLTCNLASRGKSTGQMCTNHMKWLDDSIEIPFMHGKDQQTADNAIKKLPCHCYANSLDFASDLSSSLFHYMVLFPDVIANCEESLFPGSWDGQAQKFGRIVARVCQAKREIIENSFGFKIKDIGVHSWRKCTHTLLNCGSTAGPSVPAACIRPGHSMGGNKDVYIAQEKASDTYCGCILAGLPAASKMQKMSCGKGDDISRYVRHAFLFVAI
jgi:hypothetical protein